MRVLERCNRGWLEDLSEAPFNRIPKVFPDSCTGTALAIFVLMISPMLLATAAIVIPLVLAFLLGLAAMFVLPAGVLAISVLLVLRESSRFKQGSPSTKHVQKSEIASQDDRGILVPSVRMIHTGLVQLSDALRLSNIVMPWFKLLNPEMRLRVSVEVAMRTSNDDLYTVSSSKMIPSAIVGNSVCLPMQPEQPKELRLLHKPEPVSLSTHADVEGTMQQTQSSPNVAMSLHRGPSGSQANMFLSERRLLENKSSMKGVHKFHEWLEASRSANPPVVEPVVSSARLCRKSTSGSLLQSPSLPNLISLRREDSDHESESSRPMSFSECARSSAVPHASAICHRRLRSLDRVAFTDSTSASATWSDSERALRRRRLEKKDSDPGFALRQAVYARNNQQWRLKHLLRRNADPNTCNHRGSSPLHIAAWHGKGLDALKLVEYGAALNAQDKSGLTPLHIAVWKNHLSVLSVLLHNGADVNIRCHIKADQAQSFLTPLHFALLRKNKLMVHMLLLHNDPGKSGGSGKLLRSGSVPDFGGLLEGPMTHKSHTQLIDKAMERFRMGLVEEHLLP